MKKSFWFFLPVLFLAIATGLSCFAQEAKAATYYVSTSGSDNASGSQGSPFQTMQHAADVAGPGDTVVVADGAYSAFNINNSGTSGAPITFESQNKAGAVIDASGGSYAIAIESGVSYINIKDFRIENMAYDGIVGRDGVSHVDISGNDVGPVGANGTGNNGCADIDFDFSNNITVDGNIVHDSGGGNDGYSADHGIDFEGQKGSGGSFYNITIMNNVTYNNDRGWDVQIYDNSGANPAVTGLNIIGNTFTSHNPDNYGQLGLYMPMSGALVEDNIFYDPGDNTATYPSGRGFTADNNLTTASTFGSGASGTGGILNANPSSLFVNAGSGDFHLQSSSPAISAGLAWSGRTSDADGNPVGNPPDIGAYDYSAAGSGSASSGGGTSSSTTGGSSTAPSSGGTSSSTSATGGPASSTPATSTTGTSTTATSTATVPSSVTNGTSSTAPGPAATSSAAQITPPQLLTPSLGQKVSTSVTLQWSPAKDASPVSYTVYISQSPDFSNATPIKVAWAQESTYAMGGGAAAFLMFGLAIPGWGRRRGRLVLLLLAGAMAAGLLVSCGGSSGGSQPSASPQATTSVSPVAGAVSYTVSGLSSNTTYYWKVVAKDNTGNAVQSQTGSFQTS